MYDLDINPEVDKIFVKLAKKDRQLLLETKKKLVQIQENPFHSYKSLRNPMQNFNRVHVKKHFVIIFKIDHERRQIIVTNFKHHDKAYL